MFNIKYGCICCQSNDLEKIIDFGHVPSAGSYVINRNDAISFPLSLSLCKNCFHVQVNEYIDKEYLFKDYRYISGISMTEHFSTFSKVLDAKFGNGLTIIEIGSNDGTFIDLLLKNGNDVTGVEPSINVAEISKQKGHAVINDFFSKSTLEKNNVVKESVDIITASNCFAHIENIDAILDGVNFALSKDGTFIVEVHYGPKLFDTLQYDFIYHEHMYYYSLSSLKALFERNGLYVYNVDFIDTHGGSVRVYASKSLKNGNFLAALIEESRCGFHEVSTYRDFSTKVEAHINKVKDFLTDIKSSGKRIIGYGAAGRANAFLNYAGINSDIIDFIIDDSPERYGRYIPKQNIPIRSFQESENIEFDILFITAWNFFDKITQKAAILNYTHNLIVFPDIRLELRRQ